MLSNVVLEFEQHKNARGIGGLKQQRESPAAALVDEQQRQN